MDNFTETLSKNFGLPWTGLLEHCRKTIKDKPPDKMAEQGANAIATRLCREDESTFGLRPGLDECLLTKCEQCGAVIKTQALFSHIETRHNSSCDESSVQHLLTQKPIVKGLSLKSKNKSSPRNSPKLSSNCDANLLDKYKLPKPPVNRISGRFAPGSLEQSNSALAKQLRSCGAQPVVALDDVSLSTNLVNPSSEVVRTDCDSDANLTPKSRHISASDNPASKQLSSKRSLDSSLNAFSKVDSPKKPKLEPTPVDVVKEQLDSYCVKEEQKPVVSAPSPQKVQADQPSPKTVPSSTDQDSSFISSAEPPKSSPKLHQITTFDKSIPCKDREYDPNRHCGCWLEEWGKHCTRSLTCKSHALSLRRKVPGRSKPFDTLLLEHREAKEALLLSKTKVNKKKSTASSSSISNKKINRPTNNNAAGSALGPLLSDVDQADTAQPQMDYLGYSALHPRPLAAPCYGARLCGSAYVSNRQMDALRFSLKQAIETPKQPKKSCSTKNIKSVNGGASKPTHLGHSALPASSLALLQSAQSAAKVKSLSEKKKKAKRSSSADNSKTVHPPFSHRMSSPPSVPASPSQCLTLSDSNQPSKSADSLTSASPINLFTNGVATQFIRANRLKDVGIWPTARQKSGSAEVNKSKLNNVHSISLPTSSTSGILHNKHRTLLDGHPYTLYSTTATNDGNASQGQPVLINSSDIRSKDLSLQGSANRNTDNQQSTILELRPQHANSGISHLSLANIQYKSESGRNSGDGNFLQTCNSNEKVPQQFTIANGSAVASLNSVRALQLKQTKPTSAVTIPIGTQASLGQQQTLHHSSPTAAAAHHGYG